MFAGVLDPPQFFIINFKNIQLVCPVLLLLAFRRYMAVGLSQID